MSNSDCSSKKQQTIPNLKKSPSEFWDERRLSVAELVNKFETLKTDNGTQGFMPEGGRHQLSGHRQQIVKRVSTGENGNWDDKRLYNFDSGYEKSPKPGTENGFVYYKSF